MKHHGDVDHLSSTTKTRGQCLSFWMGYTWKKIMLWQKQIDSIDKATALAHRIRMSHDEDVSTLQLLIAFRSRTRKDAFVGLSGIYYSSSSHVIFYRISRIATFLIASGTIRYFRLNIFVQYFFSRSHLWQDEGRKHVFDAYAEEVSTIFSPLRRIFCFHMKA